MLQLFGRFHPLIVHLPIGILLLAFGFELLSWHRYFRKLSDTVQPALLVGALSTILAVITGLLLASEGGYDNTLLIPHKNLGLITVALALAAWAVRHYADRILTAAVTRRWLCTLVLFPVVGLVSLTGHYGGALTHGADYLTFVPTVEDEASAQVTLAAVTNVEEAVMYEEIVKPILEAKCYSCHSASRQKGQLRLDGIDMIEKGGKHGPVLVTGLADSSALYHRLVLPIEDTKHMPPEEKPQLSSAELDLIHTWVADGYQFNKKVSAYTDKDKIADFVKAIQSAGIPKQSWVPATAVAEADPAAVQRLKDKGVLIMPVAQESHYLMANFINARAAGDSALSLLLPLREQLLWLNLERATLTDAGMDIVAKLDGLRVLSLKDVKIGDTGVARLISLPNLTSLNLVGTTITDAALKALEKAPKLERLFLFQTAVSPAAIGELAKARVGLHVDTGHYQLPFIVTDTLVYKRK
jgi:uncharacterized membrane protein/mono/diheme cytochrome c family protein